MKYLVYAFTTLDYKVIYNYTEITFSITSSASATGEDLDYTKNIAAQISRDVGFKEEMKILGEITAKYQDRETYYDTGSVGFINKTTFSYNEI